MSRKMKNFFYFFLKICAKVIFFLYFRLGSKGKENIPKKGKLIVAANHSSYLDPFVLGTCFPRKISFIMTSLYYEKPFLKPFCYLLDAIPVGEGFYISAYKKVVKKLNEGGVIGIFPEGRRSREGILLDARKGVGFYSLRTKSPVLPCAIIGARESLPPSSFFPKPVKIKIVFGKPITFEDDVDAEIRSEIVKKEIENLFLENGHEDYIVKEE